MKIREFNYTDENMINDCCICGEQTADYVIDFNNFKVTLCKYCIDKFIQELQQAKQQKFCRECSYKKRNGKDDFYWFTCGCSESKEFGCSLLSNQWACKYFNEKD